MRQQSEEDQGQFFRRLNQNAAAGNYKVRVSGPLDNPAISGIPELIARIIADITLAAPFAVVGGLVNLGKDAPGALINAPRNVGRGIGNMLGNLTGNAPQGDAAGDGSVAAEDAPQQPDAAPEAPAEQQGGGNLFRGLLRGGGNR